MAEVKQALEDVKELYQKVVGQPAPEVTVASLAGFPPGVDPVQHAVEEVQRLKQLCEQVQAVPTWIPRADLFAARDGYLIRVEIPGVSRDQVKVLASTTECLVVGERRPPQPDALTPMNVELAYGRFERRFPVPLDFRPERLTARWTEGLLEIRLAMDPTSVPKVTNVEIA